MAESVIDKIKAKIGGDFKDNLMTEEDLENAFKVILGYFDMEVPDGVEGDPKKAVEEQAQAQAKLIAHFVQNTAMPKEEGGGGGE